MGLAGSSQRREQEGANRVVGDLGYSLRAMGAASPGRRRLPPCSRVAWPSAHCGRPILTAAPADLALILTLGQNFDRLSGLDRAARCRVGSAHDKNSWAGRRQALTKSCSAVWAGTTTKGPSDALAPARRNQSRHLAALQQAIALLTGKLALLVHSGAERKALIAAKSAPAQAAAAGTPGVQAG